MNTEGDAVNAINTLNDSYNESLEEDAAVQIKVKNIFKKRMS